MRYIPQCYQCTHYHKDRKGYTCEAYPKGLPLQILLNKVSHKKSYKDDHGILFSDIIVKGGPGSGNFGHEGRPGEVGGSGGGGGAEKPVESGYPKEGFKTNGEINNFLSGKSYVDSNFPPEFDNKAANEIAREIVNINESGKFKVIDEKLHLEVGGTRTTAIAQVTYKEGTAEPTISFNKDYVDGDKLSAAGEQLYAPMCTGTMEVFWGREIKSDGAPANAAGWFEKSDVTKSFVDHEYAHVIYNNEATGTFELQNDWLDIQVALGEGMGKISEYATSSEKEGFAEAYSVYVNGTTEEKYSLYGNGATSPLDSSIISYFDKMGVTK
jgi:hypothetical protein